MDEKDLPSSSDESDADFVPKAEDCNSESGSEVSDYVSSDGDDDSKKGKKRKKKNRKGSKKQKTNKNEEEENEQDEKEKERSKIDVDALWADFKKDVNNRETKKTADARLETDVNEKNNGSDLNTNEIKPKINKGIGNPGLQNKSKGGGLSSVLSQIGKKDKMSTLRKSQLDWNNFKKSEGIEEEIKQHNRGKDGYLEKQDFLQRTDLRQFEIEKDLRSARRKF